MNGMGQNRDPRGYLLNKNRGHTLQDLLLQKMKRAQSLADGTDSTGVPIRNTAQGVARTVKRLVGMYLQNRLMGEYGTQQAAKKDATNAMIKQAYPDEKITLSPGHTLPSYMRGPEEKAYLSDEFSSEKFANRPVTGDVAPDPRAAWSPSLSPDQLKRPGPKVEPEYIDLTQQFTGSKPVPIDEVSYTQPNRMGSMLQQALMSGAATPADAFKTIMGREKTRDERSYKERLAEKNFFGKPQLKDFTPESIQKFQRSGNKADLRRVGKGQNSQILSSLMPYVLGGVDMKNPEEVQRALQQAQEFERRLRPNQQGGRRSLADELRRPLPNRQPAPRKESPGPLIRGLNYAKKTTSNVLDELASLTRGGLNRLFGPGDQEKLNALKADLIQRGLDVQLRRGQVVVNGQPLDQFMQSQGLGGGGQGFNQGGVRQPQGNFPTATREEIRRQTGVDPSVDEEGFYFTPNPALPNGRQFIRKGGKDGPKVKAPGF